MVTANKVHYCTRILLLALLLVAYSAVMSFAAGYEQTDPEAAPQTKQAAAYDPEVDGPDPEVGNDKPLQLAPVVVTAEKRSQNIQEVPTSIAAFSDVQITESGITDLQDLSAQVPNLFISNWGFRGNSFIFIRGIGAVNNDPAVGFYVDDVNYMDSRIFDSKLFDIERIEVLRGPQGTLYGRNSLGGVISIVTKEPDNEFAAGLTQRIGDYNLFETDVYMRGPLVEDKLFVGVAGRVETRDGYNHNDYLDVDGDDIEGYNGRLHLRWLATDNLNVTLNADGEKINDGAFPVTNLDQVRDDPNHFSHNYQGTDKRNSYGTSLRVAYDSPWVDVTSITSLRRYDDIAKNDQDFTQYPLMLSNEDIVDHQFTQELRFASPEDNGNWTWIGGLYGFREKKDYSLLMDFAPGVVAPGAPAIKNLTESDSDKYGVAAFGQATYTLFDKLDISAGLRYDYERSEIDYVSSYNQMIDTKFDDSLDNSAILPKFQISYNWTDNHMTYVSISRGYRSGGFNSAFINASDKTFDPEYSWNYEIGAKTSWWDNRLVLNAAAFLITLDDQQVTQTLPSFANTVIRNAGESRSIGFELEGSALLCEGLTAEAGFGYTHSEFVKYSDPALGADYKGNKTPFAPEYTYNVALQYRRPIVNQFNWLWEDDFIDIFTRAEVRGVGPFYWDTANKLKENAYELVNFRLGLESEHFDVTLWCKNAFDKEYAKVAFAWGPNAFGQAGDPRTFGVTIAARF